jgi:sporulation protein YlmC with PRC-barrel domain
MGATSLSRGLHPHSATPPLLGRSHWKTIIKRWWQHSSEGNADMVNTNIKRNLCATTAVAAALLFAAPHSALAQAAAPATMPSGTPQRTETPGGPAAPNSNVGHTQAMERLTQAAQRLRESIQAMAQQPPGERRNQAMTQAREALMSTQQAMMQLPPDMRTTQNYRDAEQRVAETRQAMESEQPDAQRAQGAVDGFLVIVPRLQADATARSGAATGTTTAGAAPSTAGGATGGFTAGVPLQRMSSLPGTDLIGPDGKKVGEIENLLVDRSGNVRAVVVEWGGFLGIGESQRLVPSDRIQLGERADDRAQISMTREQIEALPRFDRNRLAEYERSYGWGEGTRWHR